MSIRRRALDLVLALVNESNIQALTTELLDYLKVNELQRLDLTSVLVNPVIHPGAHRGAAEPPEGGTALSSTSHCQNRKCLKCQCMLVNLLAWLLAGAGRLPDLALEQSPI